ncbi:uncharacterized protein [Ptychodera flava]|uniref:uncharacterized protein n=1 Tax=Ptychodera flava TaxID=63121 RepID=UPI00396A3CC0
MAPGVLIVNEWWGGALHGGVAAATRLIARMVQAMGMDAYCTILHSNTDIETEAEKVGVKVLIRPDPQGRLRFRKPHPDWLLAHEVYFPDFKTLEEIKVVIGYGLVTSDAALRIKNTLFPTAAFFLVNMWALNDATPRTLGYDLDEFIVRCELLVEESLAADAIFSFGSKSFQCFHARYSDVFQSKHHPLLPLPECEFYTLEPNPKISEDEEIHILSALQGDDLRELDAINILAHAINKVARACPDRKFKWKILGVPAAKEDYVLSVLRPDPLVTVFPLPTPNEEDIKMELNRSHVVLVAPRSGLSLQFALTAMAAGVPIIVPRAWDCHAMIKDHLSPFESDLAVSMKTSTNALKKRMIDIFDSYESARRKAIEVKEALKTDAGRSIAEKNREFVKLMLRACGEEEPSEERMTSIIAKLLPSEEENDENAPGAAKKESATAKRKRKRSFGEVGLKVRTKGGVPKKGKTMSEADQELFGRLVTERDPDEDDNEARESGRNKRGSGGITFVMDCRSVDALECLWQEYQQEKLNKLMEETLITDATRQQIGVYHWSLRTFINYEEYHQCRTELREKARAKAAAEAAEADRAARENLRV